MEVHINHLTANDGSSHKYLFLIRIMIRMIKS